MTHTFWYLFFYFYSTGHRLSSEETSSTSRLNLLFRQLGKVLGLDNDRNIDLSISKELEVSLGDKVNDGGLSTSILGGFVHSLSGHIEQLVQVERGAEIAILHNVEGTHTDFTEVTGMVLVHEDTVMMLSSGITATSRMLTVLSNTTVTGGNVSSLLPVLR